jgi:hypothetical protein
VIIMSIRSRLLLLCAFAASFALGACGGNRPGGVVERFSTSVAEGNVDVAISLLSSRMRENFDDDKLRLQLSQGADDAREKGGLSRFVILTEAVGADKVNATVRAQATYGNGDTNVTDYQLIREAGDWKIEVQGK